MDLQTRFDLTLILYCRLLKIFLFNFPFKLDPLNPVGPKAAIFIIETGLGPGKKMQLDIQRCVQLIDLDS